MKTTCAQKGAILPHIDVLLKRGKELKGELPKYKENCTPHIKGKAKDGKEE